MSESSNDVRIFTFAGDGKWYWQDAYCDEPMGPFDSVSRRDARLQGDAQMSASQQDSPK